MFGIYRSLTSPRKESKLVAELITLICAADVVRIDDKLYGFKQKPVDDSDYTHRKVEDYETIFETESHLFNWWEIREESSKLNDREWKIANHTVSFFNITPI